MRRILAFVIPTLFSIGAAADPLPYAFQDKFQIGEIFEGAAYASEKCPGLHVDEDGINATIADLGFTLDDDVILSPEFQLWEKRGQMNSRIGYEKDPAGWCESMWHFLGPDHPPMIRHTLLGKD